MGAITALNRMMALGADQRAFRGHGSTGSLGVCLSLCPTDHFPSQESLSTGERSAGCRTRTPEGGDVRHTEVSNWVCDHHGSVIERRINEKYLSDGGGGRQSKAKTLGQSDTNASMEAIEFLVVLFVVIALLKETCNKESIHVRRN